MLWFVNISCLVSLDDRWYIYSCPQPLSVLLLDIVPMMPVLEGVVMELQDCAFPLLQGKKQEGLAIL